MASVADVWWWRAIATTGLEARRLPRRPGERSLPNPKGPGAKRPSAPATGPSGPQRGGAKPRRVKTRRSGPGCFGRMFKVALVSGLLIVFIALGGAGYVYYQAKQTLPAVDGSARLAGLSASVEVIRDERGIPHLFAQDDLDLSRATGFVHAQDRLFQMELARRLGRGRMAEWFGQPLVETDRLVRRLGLPLAAQAELDRASVETQTHLQAYAEGVNAFVATRAESPLLEYRILSVEPEPWTPVDSLAIGKWFAYVLSENASVETLRERLVTELGWESAYKLTGLEPPPQPVLQDPTAVSAAILAGQSSRRVAPPSEPRPFLQFGSFGASNAWVIGPSRSSTGKPLLASDPHLTLDMPSVWYPMHLSGDTIQTVGGTIPGLPFVVIGRNDHIAWGVTALYADVQDHYLETVNPANPEEYAIIDGWERFNITTENILVKDSSAVVEEVWRSRHGAQVSANRDDGKRMTLRWDAIWNGDHVLAALRFNQARSWESFVEALRFWSTPALSFVYADAEGNIGFFPAGDIPVRIDFDGSLPVDGASGNFEWQGNIPHELKPMSFNPEQDFIVSANHQMLAPDMAYSFGSDTLAPVRAERIAALIGTAALSLEDMARIQNDRYDATSEQLLRYLLALPPEGPQQSEAIEVLRRWNGQMTDGAAPAIFQAVYRNVVVETFRDELHEETYEALLRFLEIGHPGGIQAILDDPNAAAWDDKATPTPEDRDAILARSFASALSDLTAEQGEDPASWSWGRLHPLKFQHPLGQQRPLDQLFDRQSAVFGGSTFTIANATVSLRAPYQTPAGTSLRFLTNMSSRETRLAIPSGASGHPMSPFYFDQNVAWSQGESPTIAFDRGQIPVSHSLSLTP